LVAFGGGCSNSALLNCCHAGLDKFVVPHQDREVEEFAFWYGAMSIASLFIEVGIQWLKVVLEVQQLVFAREPVTRSALEAREA
jgi:hypothetical protein